MAEELKTCKKCKKAKPLTQFDCSNRKVGGLKSRCIPCVEYSRNYYIDNKDVVAARSKKRYQDNREEILRHRKEWYATSEAFPMLVLDRARTRAKSLGVEFALHLQDIVIPERCPILGIPLQRNERVGRKDSPSLDRIDPTCGYVPGNVQVISLRANMLKSNLTPKEQLAFARWVLAEHTKGKKLNRKKGNTQLGNS